MVENKAWDFLVAAWEGRFKDAGDAVDQSIATVGFTPEQFNTTFGDAIPHYNGTGYVNPWTGPGITYCPDCAAPFNATLGYCPRCGWKLDHYGVNITRYDGPDGWHDLVTRYFDEGFWALCPESGIPTQAATVELDASFDAWLTSRGMLLVPTDWIARKNQSMPLLRALCAARANFTINANLDITPSWGGILELPANSTTQQTLYLAADGPTAWDLPGITATIIPPDGFTAHLFPSQPYWGGDSFTGYAAWSHPYGWGLAENLLVMGEYAGHAKVLQLGTYNGDETSRSFQSMGLLRPVSGTVDFWLAGPSTTTGATLHWYLMGRPGWYYFPGDPYEIRGTLRDGEIWTASGTTEVLAGSYQLGQWAHFRVQFEAGSVGTYTLEVNGQSRGTFPYAWQLGPDGQPGFYGIGFEVEENKTGEAYFYVDSVACAGDPGYDTSATPMITQESFPLQDGRTIRFDLKPLSPSTPAGFYTAVMNLTFANGTQIAEITIPFRYAWNQSTGLEFLALPDIVTPGDVVQWGQITNAGTEPGAFLIDADGLPANWLQSTGRATLAHIGFDQGLDGFTLASASSGNANFTILQPIQVATYVDPYARYTCFGSSDLIVLQYPTAGYFGIPLLPPGTPFVAPRATSAYFFMDSWSTPTGTWIMHAAPAYDEGTLTWDNVPDKTAWWGNVLYQQPATFAFDWVRFPNLVPGNHYILELAPYTARLRSDDHADIATRPFAATTYDKVLADAGTLVIQTGEPETIAISKPVTWALQAGDTITVRYSISGAGNALLTLGGQSFKLVPAGTIQYGSQVKTFTLAQNLTATELILEANLVASTLLKVDAITVERPLTLTEQASAGVAGGIYNGTINLRDALGFQTIANYAFESGTDGWTGAFTSGEKDFTTTDRVSLTYVDRWYPDSSFVGPETAWVDNNRYIIFTYLRSNIRQQAFPGFISSDTTLQLRLRHPVAGTLGAWTCAPWDWSMYRYNGQPITYNNQPPSSTSLMSSVSTTGLPAGAWVALPGMDSGPYRIIMTAPSAYMDVYGSASTDSYPRAVTLFENFGAAQGQLLLQADEADAFIAYRTVDLHLRQGDRIRVAFTTTGIQLVTLRAGSAAFTLVPTGNANFGAQEVTFTIPADMDVAQLEIAGYLGAKQYLHVDAITIERPAQVLPYVYGHRDVLALGAAAGGVTGAEYAINSPLTGTMEMWVAGSNLTAPLAIELAGDNGFIRLGFENQQLRAWDGLDIITLASFSTWTGWTHLRVDFDLVTNTYSVWVNNVTVAQDLRLTATGAVTALQELRLATTIGDHSYFADAVTCTWMDLAYTAGDNLWPAWAGGSEQLFFVAPGGSRSLEIVVPRHYSIAPGARQFVAKVVDPITRRLLGVYATIVHVGEFYDIGLEVIPVHAAGMPGTRSTYVVRATNLGNVQQTITLSCEGGVIVGWSFATSSETLDPGQTFSSELVIDPAIFEAGVQMFTVQATTALNATATGASYIVNDVPVLSTPLDFSYESGTTGHGIQWDIDDTYFNSSVSAWNLSRAVLGGAGVPVASGTWNESRVITVPVDGLSAGTYVHTLQIQDGFGGMAQDKVVLVVTQDGVAFLPVVRSTDAPAGENQAYMTPLGNSTLEVAFNATAEVTLVVGAWNDNPTGLDPGFVGEGQYFAIEASNETAITFPMYVTVPLPAGIPPGATEQEVTEMIVPFTFDEGTGTWAQQDFVVTVDLVGGTATVAVTHLSQFAVGVLNFPPAISRPPDLCFEVGTLAQEISWVVTDATTTRPTFAIIVDGVTVSTGSWQSGIPISIPLTDLVTGNHTVTIIAFDGRGSVATDGVEVNVLPDEDVSVDITNLTCNVIGGIVTLIFLDVDASGITRVDWVAVNGIPVQDFVATVNGSWWVVMWVNNCTRGNYTVTFGLTDADNDRPGDAATASFSTPLEIPWASVAEGLLRDALAECSLLLADINEVDCWAWRLVLQVLVSHAEANLQQALTLVLANCTDRAAIRVWVARCQIKVADIIAWVGGHVGSIDLALASRLHARIGSLVTTCGALLELLAGD